MPIVRGGLPEPLHQPLGKHELACRIVSGALALVGAALTAFGAALLAGQFFGS